MSLFSIKAKQGNVVWIETNRLATGGKIRITDALATEDQLSLALSSLPTGPTKWILDDVIAPSIILKDIIEVPKGSEAREAFFRWKYGQALAVEGAYAVQGLSLGEQGWLLSGMPLDLQETWINLAAKLGRPLHAMIPRWLWLYNRAASTREKPGMLLSLCKAGGETYTGSIATWGKTLSLIRQWSDSADIRVWMSDRIEPTIAFLQRDGKTPMELLVWGPDDWPTGAIPHKVFQSLIPNQEAI
ncbi:MAG: hypothetical protein LBQ86_08310 [Holophagales bacterium]|jgi:hypothetical protein|nr:hypothetical protein [Holophagales bacterium]